jgi:hypothetical protein
VRPTATALAPTGTVWRCRSRRWTWCGGYSALWPKVWPSVPCASLWSGTAYQRRPESAGGTRRPSGTSSRVIYTPHTPTRRSRSSWSRGWPRAWTKRASTGCGCGTRGRPRGARCGTRLLASSRSATTTHHGLGKNGCSCRCRTPAYREGWSKRLGGASRRTPANLQGRQSASGSSPAASCAAASVATP